MRRWQVNRLHMQTNKLKSWINLRWLSIYVIVVFVLTQSGKLYSDFYINIARYYLSHSQVGKPSNQIVPTEQAVAAAKRALQFCPASSKVTRLQLQTMLLLGETEAAFSMMKAQISEAKTDELLILFVGLAFWESESHYAALALWRQIPNIDLYFSNRSVDAYYQGHTDEAWEYYEISMAIRKTPSLYRVRMFMNMCDYVTGQGNYMEAVQVCSLAVEASYNALTLLRLGRAHYYTHNYLAAQKVLNEGLTLRTDIADIYYYLGLTYRKQGSPSLALSTFEGGLSVAPQHPYLNLVTGDLRVEIGDLEAAANNYRNVIEHFPNTKLADAAKNRLQTLERKKLDTNQ